MFAKRLRELRESNHLSMDKLVEIYNKKFNGKMNKSTLSRYENGLQDPIYTVVVNLAELFGVSVDFISGFGVSSNTIKCENTPALTDKESAHINVYRRLNDKGKERVDTYTNDLAENPKYTTEIESKPIRLHTKHDTAPQTFINADEEEIVTIPIVARNGNTEPINMNRKELKELKKELDALLDDKNDENEIIPLDED